MVLGEDTGTTDVITSSARVQAIREALATHIDALVGAAHTPTDGVLIVEFRPDMTFVEAKVVPNGLLDMVERERPAGYLVRLCSIVAWRPWIKRDLEMAIKDVDAQVIFQGSL